MVKVQTLFKLTFYVVTFSAVRVFIFRKLVFSSKSIEQLEKWGPLIFDNIIELEKENK